MTVNRIRSGPASAACAALLLAPIVAVASDSSSAAQGPRYRPGAVGGRPDRAAEPRPTGSACAAGGRQHLGPTKPAGGDARPNRRRRSGRKRRTFPQQRPEGPAFDQFLRRFFQNPFPVPSQGKKSWRSARASSSISRVTLSPTTMSSPTPRRSRSSFGTRAGIRRRSPGAARQKRQHPAADQPAGGQRICQARLFETIS